MIHELIGIKDNTAELISPKIPEQYRWATAVTETCCMGLLTIC